MTPKDTSAACKEPRPCRRRECRYLLPRGKCTLDVVKAHADGMTLEEIGELLGVTAGHVEKLIRGALEKTARRIEREDRERPAPRDPRLPAIDPYRGRIDPYGGERR